MVSEFRTIAADHLWMSPCYRQTSMALHFTWKPDMKAVTQVLPMIEEKLVPFHAKPHWGKVFTMQPEHLRTLHPKLPDYVALAKEYDPQGKFRNQFLNTNVFGS
jgi:alditol oxidase